MGTRSTSADTLDVMVKAIGTAFSSTSVAAYAYSRGEEGAMANFINGMAGELIEVLRESQALAAALDNERTQPEVRYRLKLALRWLEGAATVNPVVAAHAAAAAVTLAHSRTEIRTDMLLTDDVLTGTQLRRKNREIAKRRRPGRTREQDLAIRIEFERMRANSNSSKSAIARAIIRKFKKEGCSCPSTERGVLAAVKRSQESER